MNENPQLQLTCALVVNSGTVVRTFAIQNTGDAGLDQSGTAKVQVGRTVVVGAKYEASSATGVSGNQNDKRALYSGAAYIFTGLGPGPQLTILRDGGFIIRFHGIPGLPYSLQRAPQPGRPMDHRQRADRARMRLGGVLGPIPTARPSLLPDRVAVNPSLEDPEARLAALEPQTVNSAL